MADHVETASAAIQADWLGKMRSCRLHRYDFDAALFEPWHDEAGKRVSGQWIARTPIEPLAVSPVDDLFGLHASAGIELRLVSNLWPLADLARAGPWDFSIVRMANAQPDARAAVDGDYAPAVSDELAYIKRIRSKVGHELLLLPAVTTLIWDEGGRLLLVRHAHNGQWGTVGGMIDPDEAPADAARREAMEEVNVEVRLDRIRGAVGGPQHRMTYPNGDECSYVAVVYDATIVTGTVAPDNTEVTEVRWFDVDELASADLGEYARALLGDLGLV